MQRDREPLSSSEIERIAVLRFGKVTKRTRDELRFGRQGKIAVVLTGDRAGCWYDYSLGEGGKFWSERDDGAHAWTMPHTGKPTSAWPYHDRAGNLAVVTRHDDGDGGKTYRPGSLNGKGEISRAGIPEAGFRLYREDELADYPNALVVMLEGEKATDAALFGPLYDELRARGIEIVAVCWAGGSGQVAKADFSALRGRDVVLVPDNDDPGRKAMATAAEMLIEAGAKLVSTAQVPEWLPKGWDVADDLPLDRLTWAMFAALILEAPIHTPHKPRQDGEIRTANFLELLTEPDDSEPDFIEPAFLAPGGFLLIAGPPKAQKSFLLQEILIACATGTGFLEDLFKAPRPLRVFYLQAEMNRALLRKRAREVRGISDNDRRLLETNFKMSERFHMPLNEQGTQTAIATIRREFPNPLEPPDIIAFDPLANLYDGESENDSTQIMRFLSSRLELIRQAINPMAALALSHHANKRSAEELAADPFSAIRGASALRGYYDSAIVIFRKSMEGKMRELHFELRGGESPDPVHMEMIGGRFTKSTGEITRSIAVEMLEALHQSWLAGRPLSLAPQTKNEGRYAPRVLHSKFGMPGEEIRKLIEDWLQNEVVVVAVCDTHSKVKGLKKLNSL